MNKKKKVIEFNQLSKNLVFKNKISVLIIFMLTLSASFTYNKYFKDIKYEYSIKITASQTWISESEIVNNLYESEKLYQYPLKNYLNKLPPNVRDKNFTFNSKSGAMNLSFNSFGPEPLNVDNFLNLINKEAQDNVFKQINSVYKTFLRKEIYKGELKLDDIDNEISMYPLLLKIQKIEEILRNFNTINKQRFDLSMEMADLKYYLDNFKQLFSGDIYSSLNGWQIRNNNFTNTETIFAGLLFGFLINCFFLFFKSKYFRDKLSN